MSHLRRTVEAASLPPGTPGADARGERRFLGLGLVLALTVCVAQCRLPTAGADDGSTLPISVPVQVLSSAGAQPAPPVEGPAPQRQPPQPTLPDGKLPQYQMGQLQRTYDRESSADDPRVRLLLALPSQPIVIEATILIDGEPFRQARRRRIDTLLSQATSAPDASSSDRKINEEHDGKEEQVPDVSDTEEVDDAEEEVDDDSPSPAETTTPATLAPYVLPGSAAELVRRYSAAADTELTPDEVGWLLTNLIEGPQLLFLNANFQRFRANERPLFVILDRDSDDEISAEELSRAVQSFEECDLNRDDVVDALELARVANDPRRRALPTLLTGTLLTPLPDAESAGSIYQQLASRYAVNAGEEMPVVPRFDVDRSGHFDADEVAAMANLEPDVRLSASFDMDQPERSTLVLTGINPALDGPAVTHRADRGTISLELHGSVVEFAAVQGEASDQVALGAVADGYPLLPRLDPDDNGRFTIRERRQLISRLKSLDTNDDGRLSREEVRPPIRVCLGLGPLVHRVLAGIRGSDEPSRSPVVDGPPWFVRMDRNKDRDLTRSEFPGTDEQFALLDADNDQLVSSQEALDFDASQTSSDETSTAIEPATTPPITETD